MPDLTGQVAVVTGATSGLGRQAAVELASRGAHVVVTGRDERRGKAVVDAARRVASAGELKWMPLDLAGVDGIIRFADTFHSQYGRLNTLVNNAGVMMVPEGRTIDGCERHFGVNHLGHFALTAALLPTLLKTTAARIVTVTSASHHMGRIDMAADPTGALTARTRPDAGPYRGFAAYALSKLANLVFAVELQRRLDASGSRVRSLAAQPSLTRTAIADRAGWGSRLMIALGRSPARGVTPVLYAATEPGVEGGSLFAPGGTAQIWGSPVAVRGAPAAYDPALGDWLWQVSQSLTGVHPPLIDRQTEK
ncbi:SDR family NAD(P)-dependent oxidoreductase [Streptomyces sp. NPDC088752]|uniref:SDR family NAD(P)-dependent oxidoreductase n=1 Tax=Streptomyces sp. NPDC088752 TaxID=3154963 RepID=UPI00343706BC